MADKALTLAALARFHREVLSPEFKVLGEGLQRANARIDEVHGQVEGLYGRFDRLESEYRLLTAGLRAVEERLEH